MCFSILEVGNIFQKLINSLKFNVIIFRNLLLEDMRYMLHLFL
jgi:hypothetical protein